MKEISESVGGVIIDGSEVSINEVSKIFLSDEVFATLNKENLLIKPLKKVSQKRFTFKK